MERSAPDFNPSAHADVPLYNIQAVASGTGVPTITLRSWERRYGVPAPHRDAKGYRLYSDRDIAMIRWLRERVARGVGISQAVNMLHALGEDAVIGTDRRALDVTSLQERLLGAVENFDEVAARDIIVEALGLMSVEDTVLSLFQPALYAIGTAWSEGRLSVTSEHFGSYIIRSATAQLMRLCPTPLRAERLLIGCAPGEMHDIGALTLALFFRRRGFDVIFTGANVEAASFVADVRRIRPAAVLLSATCSQGATAVSRVYRELSTCVRSILTCGGQAYDDSFEMDVGVGILLGRDAAEAATNLERHLGALPCRSR